MNVNPIFIRIAENLETTHILDDLTAHPIDIQLGQELNIGGNTYTVSPLKNEQGEFAVKDSKDDLRSNLRAYEELERAGISSAFPLDDLCLRNKRNGNTLIEVHVPESFYKASVFNPLFEIKPNHFFVRLDSSMLNTRLREENAAFEEVEVKMTPCMFAADSAVAVAKSGKHLPITERSTVIDEPIDHIYTPQRFTFYEREIVSRLVGVVNILTHSGKLNKVTTVLPHGAYYSFLFGGAAAGFVSPELILDWFDSVDRRVKHLRLLIKKGIHQYAPPIQIAQYSPMDAACGVMRAYFEERVRQPQKPVILAELFDLVLNTIIDRDSFVSQALEQGIQCPTDFRSLADFTYAMCNLQDMELIEGKPQKPKLVLGVFDVSEMIAWNATKKLRNGGLLTYRGQFDAQKAKNTTYDHLSYLNIMPIEHITFDVSPEFVEKYMGGSMRLYSLRHKSLPPDMDSQIIQPSLGLGS
jgi:hypothetical protein